MFDLNCIFKIQTYIDHFIINIKINQSRFRRKIKLTHKISYNFFAV